MKPEAIIKKLKLLPHPEGGYFKEIYRAAEKIQESALPDRYSGSRSFSTSIYFLLRGDDISHFHKIKSDEIWHFYSGSTIIIHELDEVTGYKKIFLGSHLEKKELLQYVIKKGTWFAAEVRDKKSYGLIGCTVAPGFDFDDFELATEESLLLSFPSHKKLIKKFVIKKRE